MMDGWADTITFLNHSQEMQFRQLGFMGRLQQNLSRLGFEGMEGLERFHGILQNTKKLDDDLNFAITDAVDHSLKQTFSMGPGESTFGKAILDTYQKIPFLAGLGPYFPRFMVNQFRWINEHNPLGMLSLASKDFRKELMEQAANPKGMSKKSVQKMGQAMNGFAMWMVASYLRDSEYAGPKYYQIRTGKDEQGNEKMWDLRSYQPFTSILFFQDMMRSIGRGEAININAAELNEAVTGLRRSAEVPLLAFTDVIRNIDSTNPDTFVNSLKPFVGQFIAAPFIPLRSMLDLAGGTVSPGMAEYKDTAGNELTGPLLSNIPGAREALPDRIDPFTGQSSKTDHPVLRQLGGVSLKTVTPLDDLIQQSNLSLGDLLGNYADPEARQMVAKKIGEFLNTEVGGTTINSKLANMISTLTASASIEDRRDLIRKVYSELRGDAKRAAMKENLLPFLEDAIRSRPEGERALLREQAKKLKEKYKSSSTPK
jgi:hypothetical protein